jgi:hypothetical protein
MEHWWIVTDREMVRSIGGLILTEEMVWSIGGLLLTGKWYGALVDCY